MDVIVNCHRHTHTHTHTPIVPFPAPGEGGWAPERSDRQPWLQLDLREKMEITAIATQGRSGSSDWVSSFMLLFSDSSLAWKQYGQSEDTGVRLCLSGRLMFIVMSLALEAELRGFSF